MPWIRLDDQWFDHPKFLGVSDAGQILWIKGLTYAVRHLTDGFIPSLAVPKFLQDPKRASAAIKDLIRAGLWIEVQGGYQVHDYKDYQPLASKVKAERAATRERVKRWRETHLSESSNAVTGNVTNAVSNGPPRAGDGLSGSGSGSGGGSRGATIGLALPPVVVEDSKVTAIRNRILRWPIFENLNAQRLATEQADWMMTAPQKIDWVLRAIDECARKCADGTPYDQKHRMLVGFMQHARKPRTAEEPLPPSHAPSTYDPHAPETPEEKERAEKFIAESKARAEKAAKR